MMSRALYVVFLYYLVFEGAFRKWVWPSASNELFLLKDVLVVSAVMVLFLIDGGGSLGPVSCVQAN